MLDVDLKNPRLTFGVRTWGRLTQVGKKGNRKNVAKT